MSSESYKIDEIFPAARAPEEPRQSSVGGTTSTTSTTTDQSSRVEEEEDDHISPARDVSLPSSGLGSAVDGKGQDGGTIKPVRPAASPAPSRHAIPVPKGERRGLFPGLSVVAEVDDPHLYDNSIKWMLTLFVAIAACAAPMGSAIFYRESPWSLLHPHRPPPCFILGILNFILTQVPVTQPLSERSLQNSMSPKLW
jgi:hypothetical protein